MGQSTRTEKKQQKRFHVVRRIEKGIVMCKIRTKNIKISTYLFH